MTSHEAKLLSAELDSADVIRVESNAVRSSLLDRGVREDRIVYAPPGVDLDRFSPGSKPTDRVLVAFIGTLSLWKGVDAIVELSRRLEGWGSLEVVGGPVDPWSRRLANEGILTKARDVPDLLGRAHALVLPSASDGFGYVVLEAMASGAVPFVTPAVGASEVVERLDTRLVHEPAHFADAVSELLRVVPLSDLGRRAREIAVEHERERMAVASARAVLDALPGLDAPGDSVA